MTMQTIVKKMLLGTQFPMLDVPAPAETLNAINGDIADEAFVLTLTEE